MPRDPSIVAPSDDITASPLVIFRNLWRDNCVISDKIEKLGLDANGLHGDLQVMLSALRRMQAGVEALLALEEGESHPSAGGPQ